VTNINDPQAADIKSIEDDIHIIVGGNFTPDSLGPEVYHEILTRARSRAKEYIEVFESLFLGPNFDAIAQSRLHLPAFLKLLVDIEPDLVRAAADRLLKQYNAVLVVYDNARDRRALLELLPEETRRLSRRLERRRMGLQDLIK
jgi:hypothetical protein